MNLHYEVCRNCVDKYCCHGLCRELNNYLIGKIKNKRAEDNKSSKKYNKSIKTNCKNNKKKAG